MSPVNLARARALYERAVDTAEHEDPEHVWRHWDELTIEEQQLWVDALVATDP